jgi:Domain of unknown function DUF11
MEFRLVGPRRMGFWLRCGVGLAVAAVICVALAATAPAASAETWTVDTTADPSSGEGNCSVAGECTLRVALEDAAEWSGPGPAIVDATHVSGTITLLDEHLELYSGGATSITVEGPGPGQLTVDGGEQFTLFEVNYPGKGVGAELKISGMTLAHGEALGSGAAIYDYASENGSEDDAPLTLEDVHLVENSSGGDGGAIRQEGGTSLTLIDCLMVGNSATDRLDLGRGYGGAIWSSGVLTLRGTQVGTVADGSNSAVQNGGGIEMSTDNLAEPGSLIVEDGSSVAGNTAEGAGGGIDLSNGSNLTLDGSEVTDNVAGTTGGGINGDEGDVGPGAIYVQNGARVDDNIAGTGGGGIYQSTGTVAVQDESWVDDNRTQEGDGGGIYAAGGPAQVSLLEGSEVAQNRAEGAGAVGGGIFVGAEESLTLEESTVAGNLSAVDGGGVFSEGAGTVVSASTIVGNLARGEGGGSGSPTGGGLNVTGGPLTMTSSTVVGNAIEGAGSQGGGVGFDAGSSGASATIDNSTIARNSATATTGGLLAASTTQVTSTILAENSASGCRDAGGGGLASGGDNIVGADECGFPATGGDQLNVEPDLRALGQNGGPTETMAPTEADSPAINQGADPLGLTTDQRGEPRPVPAGGQSTDVGAYEVQAPTNTTAPAIAGSPTVGGELTCEPGSWDTDHVTATYSYSWTADGTPVGTGASYTVALADEGDQLVCEVTVDNGAEAVTAESPALTVPAARLAVSPAGIDFGTEQSGTESVPVAITVSNPGGNPLSLGQVVLSGSGAGGFSLSDGCSGTVVAPGGACQLGVLFAPTVDGGYAATLEIPSAVGAGQVQLSGIGRTPMGAVSVTPAALNFGTLQTGTVGPPATITIADSGDAALSIGQLAIEGAGTAAYALLADGCSGTTIEPGHHCEAEVRFAPITDGSSVASLLVPNSAEDERVDLGGIGRTPTGAIAIVSTSLDFGTLETGTTSAPQELTVANSGDAPLTLGELALGGPDASQFSLAAGCSGTTLAPGEGCAVAVSFAPVAAGELSAALEIPSSVGPRTVSLAGVGQAPSSPPANGGSPGGAGAGAGAGTGPSGPAGESADLRIHLGAPRRTTVGDDLTAELTIANRGPDTARSIEVTTSLGGVDLGDVDARGSRCRGGHKIECAIASLAPGRRVKLKITAIARRPGTLRIAAAAHGVTTVGSPASDRDHLTVRVAPRRRQ